MKQIPRKTYFNNLKLKEDDSLERELLTNKKGPSLEKLHKLAEKVYIDPSEYICDDSWRVFSEYQDFTYKFMPTYCMGYTPLAQD